LSELGYVVQVDLTVFLFKVPDAVRLLGAGAYARAWQVLIRAQQQVEEQYIKDE